MPEVKSVIISPKRERTREAILDAANSIFATKSIDRVSVDEIAKIVGISKGSFYNYFGDRDALALAVWEKIWFELEDQFTQSNKGISDPAHRLIRVLSLVLKEAMETPKRMQALLAIAERDASTDKPLNFGLVSDITLGLAEDTFKNVDLDTAMLVVSGMMGVAAKRISSCDATVKQTYDMSTNIGAAMLRALGVPNSKAHPLAERSAREILLSGFDADSISSIKN